MKVSVIIPTYNGAHKIMDTIRSLEIQTHAPDEVIIVVDGSTDGTYQLLKSAHIKLNNLNIIEQENTGRASVKNRGVKEATGELLMFFDDDMILDYSCIENHISHHKKYEDTLLTGRLDAPDDDKAGSDIDKYMRHLNSKWGRSVFEKEEKELLLNNLYFSSANCSIPKHVFDAIGGFFYELTDGEDYILAYNAILKGYRVFVSNKASAIHNSRFTFQQYLKRLTQYETSRENIKQLLPDVYQHIISTQNIARPDGLKALIYKGLSNTWATNLIFKKRLMWLPPAIRFKLYDAIITANGVYFPGRAKF